MGVRVGCLNYINILPVTHALGRGEKTANWDITYGSPARLNALMAAGALDVSPISSIEYARHQEEYVLLPGLTISSRGAVQSVMLFARHPLQALGGESVGICSATATSRVLLRILLEDFVQVTPQYLENASLEDARSGRFPAVLLIGDEALAFRQAARHDPDLAAYREYDLGALWLERTGLPMVFAVWAMRRAMESSGAAHALIKALHRSRHVGVGLPDDLLAHAAGRTGMSESELRTYYGGLHYSLGTEEEKALITFYRHAAAKGLCPPCTRLEVATVPDAGVVNAARG